MARLIDTFVGQRCLVGRRWFISKPIVSPLWWRLRNVLGVITGRYEAVCFAEEEVKRDYHWMDGRYLSDADVEKIKRKATKVVSNQLFSKVDKSGAPIIGRNELCPCGSGKKFKHCCGKEK